MKTSYNIKINGIVQGVGFRPFVYNLARKLSLNGWVRNNSQGVDIEIYGEKKLCDSFIEDLQNQKPKLSLIQNIKITENKNNPELDKYKSFTIIKSNNNKNIDTIISPDVAICDDCLKELFDQNDRRYLYPFINCTNCGPRYSIIKKIPYDRPFTTMHSFNMCEKCSSEYENPQDRRFHAQPIACHNCGPYVWLCDKEGLELEIDSRSNPIKETIKLLHDDKIIAVKGLGGFHLVCDASSDKAVNELKKRKDRYEKPFAIMSLSLSDVEKYAELDEISKKELESYQAPIVLIEKKKNDILSKYLAEESDSFGIMLPYTPLHYLLFGYHPSKGKSEFTALVMTSANKKEEPIVTDNDEAIERLSDIADYFLFHNRDIHIRVDDSIVKTTKHYKQTLRRSRGFAPFPIICNTKYKKILATGAELKNSIALSKDYNIFVSQYLGDLINTEVIDSFHKTIEHIKNIYKIQTEYIAYDFHPHYYGTIWAKNQSIIKIGIQHHHAHLASVLAEYDLHEPVIGLIMDGTGYGLDGNIWGSEVFIFDKSNYSYTSIQENSDKNINYNMDFIDRFAHANYLKLPGGDKAVNEPWRIAISWLSQLKDNDEYSDYYESLLEKHIENNINRKSIELCKNITKINKFSPKSCGMGRYFDAVSALLGICYNVNYEAQAAIKLENIADKSNIQHYNYDIDFLNKPFLLNYNIMLKEIIDDLKTNIDISVISAKFHNTIVRSLTEICSNIKKETGIKKIVLSGGCFQNTFFSINLLKELKELGFMTYIPEKIPVNDGSISVGQLYLANMIIN